VNIISPVVVYDACVLYPALLRDFFMRLASAGCVRAHWSRRIQDEWKLNLLRNRPRLSPSRIDETIDAMEEALPHALIEADEVLIAGLRLPDPDDRHVLATAMQCRANVIMTFNLRDFPKGILGPLGMEALHPDDLVIRCLLFDPFAVVNVVREHRAKLTKPSLDVDEYLAALRRQGLVQTSTLLAKYRDRL